LGWLESALSLSPEGEPSPDSPGDLFTCRVITDHKEKKPDRRSDTWQSILDAGKDVPAPNLPADLLFSPVLPLRYSGKPETLSPTQVMDYLKCPALYLFKHIYHLNPVKLGEQGESLGFEYGLLAHRALERWDYRTGNLLPAIVDELAERELTPELRNSLKEHLIRFIGSDLCRMIAGAEELRKEEPFAFVHDDVLVRGTMDLKVRTGDRVMIIDFKTDAALPEDVEDLVHRYQVQMEIYALAVRYAEDILPSRLILHFLTPGLTRDIPCTEESIAGISQLLTKTIASLDAGDFSPNRTERCTFCSSYSLCRICFR
jgi:CRISPR/Cas system-associated exonuclease Cas4 (RecB family)